MRRVVSNTGPILHLHEAGNLALLYHVGTVSIPPAVARELAEQIEDWPSQSPEWIETRALDLPFAQIGIEYLRGKGVDDWSYSA